MKKIGVEKTAAEMAASPTPTLAQLHKDLKQAQKLGREGEAEQARILRAIHDLESVASPESLSEAGLELGNLRFLREEEKGRKKKISSATPEEQLEFEKSKRLEALGKKLIDGEELTQEERDVLGQHSLGSRTVRGGGTSEAQGGTSEAPKARKRARRKVSEEEASPEEGAEDFDLD